MTVIAMKTNVDNVIWLWFIQGHVIKLFNFYTVKTFALYNQYYFLSYVFLS